MTRHQQAHHWQTNSTADILHNGTASPRSDNNSTAPCSILAPACAAGQAVHALAPQVSNNTFEQYRNAFELMEYDYPEDEDGTDGGGMDFGDPGGPSQSVSQLLPSSQTFSLGSLQLASMAPPQQAPLPGTPPSARTILTPQQRKSPRDPRKPATPESADMC